MSMAGKSTRHLRPQICKYMGYPDILCYTDSPSSSSEEVRWQVAFWALVPLALATMTQPGGRVLQRPPRYGPWLRSSPIVCVADILYFLTCIAINYIREPTRSWRHFKAEIAYRYRDEDWSKESTRTDGANRATLIRWIVIIVGSIPCQTIKLVAMRGIPLTKAWALLFFISLVFGEVLNIAARIICRGGPDTMPAARPLPKLTQLWWYLQSVAIQGGIFGIVLLKILIKVSTISDDETKDILVITRISTFLGAMILALLVSMLLDADHAVMPKDSETYFFEIYTSILLYPNILGVPLVIVTLVDTDSFGGTLLYSFVLPISGFYITVLVLLLSWLYFKCLSKTALKRIVDVSRSNMAEKGAWKKWFVIFLVNLALTVLGYAFVFDSKGTVAPSWVGVFG